MATEYFDVLIIGAGLSGIGAACHLKKELPHKSFAILEGRNASGGTWDLFRYPGIRSDSDMFTLGYEFKPWNNKKGIADGADIRNYIREAAAENNVEPHIRYQQKVTAARFNSSTSLWTVDVQQADGSTKEYSCHFFTQLHRLLQLRGRFYPTRNYRPRRFQRPDYSPAILAGKSRLPAAKKSWSSAVVPRPLPWCRP